MLATVRAEMLELRRDIASVLANLVVVLKIPPEERQKYVERRLTGQPSIFTAAEFAQAETFRGEILELRRDLAFTMAQLLVASVESPKSKPNKSCSLLLSPRHRKTPPDTPEGGVCE